MGEILNDKLFFHDLGLEDNEEFLNLFIPCFGINIPSKVRDFYDLITSKITLVGNGMGGASFRESRANLSNIFKDNGYCPIMVDDFIDIYEDKLMEEYYEKTKDK